MAFFKIDNVKIAGPSACFHPKQVENIDSILIDDKKEVDRTVSMSNKYFGGEVADKGAAGEADADLKATVLEAVKRVDEKMDKLRVADAITEIFGIFRRSNKYIDETMPWTLAKDEAQKDRLATVLYNLTEAITIGASLLYSFMPETAEKILAQLNTQKRTLEDGDIRSLPFRR